MDIIKIENVRIGFRPYLLLNYYILYSQVVVATITLLGVVMFYGLVKWSLGVEDFYNDVPYFQMLATLLILGFLPLWVYQKSHSHYMICKPLNESLNYTLSSEMIRIEGETFTDVVMWEDLYDVKEVINWYVFFLNKEEVVYLPKEHIEKEDIKWLKRMIREQRNAYLRAA